MITVTLEKKWSVKTLAVVFQLAWQFLDSFGLNGVNNCIYVKRKCLFSNRSAAFDEADMCPSSQCNP